MGRLADVGCDVNGRPSGLLPGLRAHRLVDAMGLGLVGVLPAARPTKAEPPAVRTHRTPWISPTYCETAPPSSATHGSRRVLISSTSSRRIVATAGAVPVIVGRSHSARSTSFLRTRSTIFSCVFVPLEQPCSFSGVESRCCAPISRRSCVLRSSSGIAPRCVPTPDCSLPGPAT